MEHVTQIYYLWLPRGELLPRTTSNILIQKPLPEASETNLIETPQEVDPRSALGDCRVNGGIQKPVLTILSRMES